MALYLFVRKLNQHQNFLNLNRKHQYQSIITLTNQLITQSTVNQHQQNLLSLENLQKRFYSKSHKHDKPKKEPCRSPTACPKPVKKKGFWKRLFGSKSEDDDDLEKKKKNLPPPGCCKNRSKYDYECPDLSQFEGQPYQTCGDAFLIQKDILQPETDRELTEEDLQLRKIEADPSVKETVNEDPLGKYETTEIRLLQMTDLKLHPLYKKYSGIKKRYIEEKKKSLYKTVSWPIDMHEIPARLNINSDIVEKKNMEYVEFKRIEPPRHLVERIIELQINARPTMEYRRKKRVPVDLKEVERRINLDVSSPAFETLGYQKGTKY